MSAGRHTETSPFGKLSEPVSLFVSESTKNGIVYLAMSRGMGISEYIRLMLDEKVHGAVKITRTSSAKHDPVSITGISEDEARQKTLRELLKALAKELNTPIDGL